MKMVIFLGFLLLSFTTLAQPENLLPTSNLPEGLTFVSSDTKSVTTGTLQLNSAVGIYKDTTGTEYSIIITQVKGVSVEDFWKAFVLPNKESGETETTFKGHKALQGTKVNYGFSISWIQEDMVISITAGRDFPEAKTMVESLAEIVESTAAEQPGFEAVAALLALGILFLGRKLRALGRGK
jgi:hypothetical protein